MHNERIESRRAFRWLAFLGLLLTAGCSGGQGSLSGKVTYQGKEVTGGSLTFAPVSESQNPGQPAAADIDSNGNYQVRRATAGRLRVTYSAPVLSLPEGRELRPGESPPRSPFEGLVPKDETVEVKPGSNTLNVELVQPSGH